MSDDAELRRAIWAEPLTDSERSIIEREIARNDGHPLAQWLRFLLTVYDEREAARGE